MSLLTSAQGMPSFIPPSPATSGPKLPYRFRHGRWGPLGERRTPRTRDTTGDPPSTTGNPHRSDLLQTDRKVTRRHLGFPDKSLNLHLNFPSDTIPDPSGPPGRSTRDPTYLKTHTISRTLLSGEKGTPWVSMSPKVVRVVKS